MAKQPANLELLAVEGAGNRFLLLDGLGGPVPDNPGGLAMALCRQGTGSSFRPDGLLVLSRPAGAGQQAQVRMVLYNADGSRPEACGNGLRCIARVAMDRGYASGPQFSVQTDAGMRQVRVEGDLVTVEMGAATIVEQALEIETQGVHVRGTLVSMGNPHFVLESGPWKDADVARLGSGLTSHVAFESGANIGFPTVRDDGTIDLRVHERGVGETQACGTGACAAAACHGWPSGMLRRIVHLPGGDLGVQRDERGVLWLDGPVSLGK